MTVKGAKGQTDHCRNEALKQAELLELKIRLLTVFSKKHKNKLYIHLNFTTD